MGDYATLKAGITANIKQNDSQLITGAVLQGQLLAMINELGAGYQFMGVATPETDPGTPDEKVFYIAKEVGVYNHFNSIQVAESELRIFMSDGSSWSSISIRDERSFRIDLDVIGIITASAGERNPAQTNFSCSGYVGVREGDRIILTGWSGSTVAGNVVGYDSDMHFVRTLLAGSSVALKNQTVEIPDGISFIRVSLGNSTHPNYIPIEVSVSTNYANITNSLVEDKTSIQSLENALGQVNDKIEMNTYIDINIGVHGTGVYWSHTPSQIVAGTYLIQGATGGVESVKLATELSAASVTRDVVVSPGDVTGEYTFNILASDIASDVAYFRIKTAIDQTITVKRINNLGDINDVVRQIRDRVAPLVDLHGKKLSIIGDSISTISGKNNPYFIVKAVDVGHSIQSYVTWWDVWSDSEGETPTNKTIGNVALTSAMIGTLQTFTPVQEDVGKEIGVPLNYNPSATIVWSQVLCETTGAVLLANASWSGARMCSGQTGTHVLSEAWSDYTIGCCKTRDDEGNDITPDIIIIFRGVNDFSHGPLARINEVSINNGVPDTDYIDSVYEFRAAYFITIKKLREAYPNAYIICCTLNVFKRMTYDVFPTRNGYYTLPQMNDAIRDIANTMGCGLIEFDKDGITFENCYPTYISDSETTPTHPNGRGHAAMAAKAIADIKYVL